MRSILRSLYSLRSSGGASREARFALVAVFTLALGLGANAAIFSVIDAVLIRPLDFAEPERLVGVWHTAPGLHLDKFEHSDGTYLVYRRHNHTLSELGIYSEDAVALTGGQQPERVAAARITGSLLTVLQVPPERGRAIVESDERPGAEPVVLLSHALWRRLFGGDPGAVGQTLRIDGVTRRIVGVMPAAFRFPSPEIAVWLPLTIDQAKPEVSDFNYNAVGRLRPGVTAQLAARELSALVWQLPREFGDSDLSRGMIASAGLRVLVNPLCDDIVGDVERVLWLLAGSVGIILLIACANVANLLLVRGEGRQREIAVRTALGASRWQVARSFLAESLSLSLCGGMVGLALAAAGVRVLVSLRPEGIPRLDEIGVGSRVALFTTLLAVLSGLAFGTVAAWRYGRPELATTLKEGGRGGSASAARHRARSALVVVQMVLALVLLVSSGLMVKSFWRLRGVHPGIAPRGVLTLHLSLPPAEYKDAAATARFISLLLERVRALPGVSAAGTVTVLPYNGHRSNSAQTFADIPLPPDAVPPILPMRVASPGYFETMGIPLLAGRAFERIDPAQPSTDAVVSAALAERFFPGKSPLGRRLALGLGGDGRWSTIVGVVGNVRDTGLHEKPAETVYYPLRKVMAVASEESGGDSAPRDFSLVVRARSRAAGGADTADALALAGTVRRLIGSTLDPNLPVAEVRTMDEVLARSSARTSFTMLLLVIAAAVALLLGAVGIYGVISYVVSQRTREIGVRMALGARRGDILRMVLGEGFVLVAAGVAIGLAGAFWATRLMASLLFDVSPTDPAIFVAVPALLGLVALVASYLPAQRAAAVEPLAAIRRE